jgi:hypothetical protein
MQDAMRAAHWDDLAYGLYNSRPLSHDTEAQERAYWQDCGTHVQALPGKRLQGRRGGGAGDTVRTDAVRAEAGCRYHTAWLIDAQPWPINGRGGQTCLDVPDTGQTNDAGMLAWHRDADDFLQTTPRPRGPRGDVHAAAGYCVPVCLDIPFGNPL